MQKGILFVSPSAGDAGVVAEMLNPLSIPLEHAPDLRLARVKLDAERFGVILTESRLPDGTWQDILDLVDEEKLAAAVVVTHPFADVRLWADVLDMGAYDLLPQPFCCAEVQRILSNALTARPEFRRVAHTAL